MIEIKKLDKVYQTKAVSFKALDTVSLHVTAGESVAVMGKSGAGKTTLMNIIGCLDNFDAGSYQLDGKDTGGMNDAQLAKIRNEKIGFVMQDFALVPHKSVLFNAMLPMYFDKTPSRLMKKKAMQALEAVGIKDQARKKVSQLSGGQKQRVAIARAIVKKPKLILADEPTGALDSKTGEDIMGLLLEMNRTGITVVVVTHDELVAGYCRRRVILHDGQIVSDSLNEEQLI